jgi:hypothetical protein
MTKSVKKIKPATKEDLQNLARGLRSELRSEVRSLRIELKGELEDKFTNLEDKISGLPTKAEFYKTMDQVMGEFQTIRDEITVLADMKRQVNDHEDRIERVEKKLNFPLPA